jgi:hypothetical protein
MGTRGMHIGFWWESQKERPLGGPRCGKDNIKMDFREVGWGGTDWIVLAQDRGKWKALVNMVINLRVP